MALNTLPHDLCLNILSNLAREMRTRDFIALSQTSSNFHQTFQAHDERLLRKCLEAVYNSPRAISSTIALVREGVRLPGDDGITDAAIHRRAVDFYDVFLHSCRAMVPGFKQYHKDIPLGYSDHLQWIVEQQLNEAFKIYNDSSTYEKIAQENWEFEDLWRILRQSALKNKLRKHREQRVLENERIQLHIDRLISARYQTLS